MRKEPDIIKQLRHEEQEGILLAGSSVLADINQSGLSKDEDDIETTLNNDEVVSENLFDIQEEFEKIDENIIELIEDIVFQLDSSGIIIRANKYTKDFFKDKNIVGEHFWNLDIFFSDLSEKNLVDFFGNIIKTEKIEKIEGKIEIEEGKTLECDFTFYPIITKDFVNSVLLIGRNVSEKKKLELKLKESKEKFDSLAEYFETVSNTTMGLGLKDLFSDVTDIIFQISPKGTINYINSAVEKMAGYSSAEMIGSNISMLIPKDEWKQFKKEFLSKSNRKNRDTWEINSFETTLIGKNGVSIPVEINGKLFEPDFGVLGKKPKIRIQGSIRNITERKKAEKERLQHAEKLKEMNAELQLMNVELTKAHDDLRIFNEDLERKVKERTAEIEKLLKHKDEFIGQLGHDLKTPITPLFSLLPIIEKKEKDPELKEYLEVANRNIVILKDLVVKTLHYERLSLPNFKIYLVNQNLSDSISDIIVNHTFNFEKKIIRVKNKVNKKIIVGVDKLQFAELVSNLFSNAIKYNKEGGEITFKAKTEKDFIKISICDTGIGLTQEQIDHIFEEFYKVDSSRHDLESSGLGLSICKRIVEKHGGEIWVESLGLGKGTTISFTMPIGGKNYEKENHDSG